MSWLEELKPNDSVIVNSTTDAKSLIKKVVKIMQPKPSQGILPGKQIILDKCVTKFSMRGRGIGTSVHRNKWLTEATEDKLKKLNA